jgi:exodeoxyribonuclease VII large subunit
VHSVPRRTHHRDDLLDPRRIRGIPPATELDKLQIPEELLQDGAQVVIGGGPDYYPGSSASSPSFSFRANHLRLAGEGDLHARLAQLRRQLEREGLFKPQKALRRPLLPKMIGVVTAVGSAASADVLAGLARRGWRGTLVWADTPVQDQKAAPQISRAIQDLAALDGMETIVVCRGGGSLTDLWAFCDEHHCRNLAVIRIPVISAVGHESDRTLIDDVAATSCSTPTHAAQAAVRLEIPAARQTLRSCGAVLHRVATRAISARARWLRDASRVPADQIRRERSRLHQLIREVRASSSRVPVERSEIVARAALVLARKRDASLLDAERKARDSASTARAIEARRSRVRSSRDEALRQLSVALRAHEPARVLSRGFALAEDSTGGVITNARDAREARDFSLRFSDDAIDVTIKDDSGRAD